MARTTEIAPEDNKLTEAGFDSAAPAPDALARLRELRANPEIPPASIARALGNIVDVGAAAILAEMETAASGPLRREIRRALFKLHQRGIEPPVAAAVGTPRPTLPEASGLSALFSPMDSEGAHVVWILKSRTQGGLIRLWGVVSVEEGLLGVMTASIARRELREAREEMERRAMMKLVEGDWRLADFILCEAYRRTPESRRGKVGDFLAQRAELIASPPPTEIDHPIYAQLAAEYSGEPSLELLKEVEIGEWRLAPAQIAPYLDELKRANESTIVLNPMQQQSRVAEIVERAVTDLFSGEGGVRLRRRLEDTGYYMLLSGRRQAAGWAAAAAARLREGADLKRIAFFQAFVRARIGGAVAEEQQRASEEPRLIVTPAEAMRASEAARRRHR